jgi:leucine dehydrogenase
VVEGAGAVGGPLCDLLADAGATLVVSDVVADRAKAVAVRVGAAIVEPEDAFDTVCDLFSPCATGAVLNADTIPRLRCRVVAGAANNQLAASVDADRLAAAGILYAPDYIVNAGGVLHLAGYERLGWTPEEMTMRLAGIETRFARCSRPPISTGSRPRRRTASHSAGSRRRDAPGQARVRSARFLA